MGCLRREQIVDAEEHNMQQAEQRHTAQVETSKQCPTLCGECTDDTHRIQLAGQANEDCKPEECVPCRPVVQAVAPFESARK